MSKCKCAKRIAALERDVTKLRAQLPKEIHHATRHEVAEAVHSHEFNYHPHAIKNGLEVTSASGQLANHWRNVESIFDLQKKVVS